MTESARLQAFRKINEDYAKRLLEISGIFAVSISEGRLLTAGEQKEIYRLSLGLEKPAPAAPADAADGDSKKKGDAI